MSDSKPEERYTDANRLIERGWKVATKFAPHYFYNVLGLFIRLFLLVGFVWMGHSMVSLSSGDHPIHYLTPFFLFLFPLSLMVTSLKRHIWSFLHLLVLIFLMCFAIWTWWRPEFPNLSSFYLVICLLFGCLSLIWTGYWALKQYFLNVKNEETDIIRIAWSVGMAIACSLLVFLVIEIVQFRQVKSPEASIPLVAAFVTFFFFLVLTIVRIYWMDSERDRRASRTDRNPPSKTVLLMEWFLPRSIYLFVLIPCLLFSEALLFQTIYCHTPQNHKLNGLETPVRDHKEAINHCVVSQKKKGDKKPFSSKPGTLDWLYFSVSPYVFPKRRISFDKVCIHQCTLERKSICRLEAKKHRKPGSLQSCMRQIRKKCLQRCKMQKVLGLKTLKSSSGIEVEVYGPKWLKWLGRIVLGWVIFIIFKQPLTIWLWFSRSFYTLKSLENISGLPLPQRENYARQRQEILENIRAHLDAYGVFWRRVILSSVTSPPDILFRRAVLFPTEALSYFFLRCAKWLQKHWWVGLISVAMLHGFIMYATKKYFFHGGELFKRDFWLCFSPLMVMSIVTLLLEKYWKKGSTSAPNPKFWILLPAHSLITLSLFYLIKKSGSSNDVIHWILWVSSWLSAAAFPLWYLFLQSVEKHEDNKDKVPTTVSSHGLSPFFYLKKRRWVLSSIIFRVHPVWSELFSVVRILPSFLMWIIEGLKSGLDKLRNGYNGWIRSPRNTLLRGGLVFAVTLTITWIAHFVPELRFHEWSPGHSFAAQDAFLFLLFVLAPSFLGFLLLQVGLEKKIASQENHKYSYTFVGILFTLSLFFSLFSFHPLLASFFGSSVSTLELIVLSFPLSFCLYLYHMQYHSSPKESEDIFSAESLREDQTLPLSPEGSDSSNEIFIVTSQEIPSPDMATERGQLPLSDDDESDGVTSERKSRLSRIRKYFSLTYYEDSLSRRTFAFASFLGAKTEPYYREELLRGVVVVLEQAQQSILSGAWHLEEDRVLHKYYQTLIQREESSDHLSPADEIAQLFNLAFDFLTSLFYDLTKAERRKRLSNPPSTKVVLEVIEKLLMLPKPRKVNPDIAKQLEQTLEILQKLLLKSLDRNDVKKPFHLPEYRDLGYNILSLLGYPKAQKRLRKRIEDLEKDIKGSVEDPVLLSGGSEQYRRALAAIFDVCGHGQSWSMSECGSETFESFLSNKIKDEYKKQTLGVYRASLASFIRLTFPTPIAHAFDSFDRIRKEWVEVWRRKPGRDQEKIKASSLCPSVWHSFRQPVVLQEELESLHIAETKNYIAQAMWNQMRTLYFYTCGFLIALAKDIEPLNSSKGSISNLQWNTPEALRESVSILERNLPSDRKGKDLLIRCLRVLEGGDLSALFQSKQVLLSELEECLELLEQKFDSLIEVGFSSLVLQWEKSFPIQGKSENECVKVTFRGLNPHIKFQESSDLILPEDPVVVNINHSLDWQQNGIHSSLDPEDYENFLTQLEILSNSKCMFEESGDKASGSPHESSLSQKVAQVRELAETFSRLTPPGRFIDNEYEPSLDSFQSDYTVFLPSLEEKQLQRRFSDLWERLDFLEDNIHGNHMETLRKMKHWSHSVDFADTCQSLRKVLEQHESEQMERLGEMLAAGLLPSSDFGLLQKYQERDGRLLFWYQHFSGKVTWRIKEIETLTSRTARVNDER